MLQCNKTISVTSLIYDPDTDTDTPCTTTITGVSWWAQVKAVPTGNGLQSACVYKCRIPADQSVGLTLRPGDKITCGSVTAAILAVHDNTGSRALPHLFVEAS